MEQLTQRERAILQDQLRHEQVCISKYRSYAARSSSALRNLFNEFARDEENHYQALSGLLSGREGSPPSSRAGQPYRFRGELRDGFDEQAATSGGRSVPVDSFGRQSEWQSTARQMLFERQPVGGSGNPSRQSPWGGLLPGDVPDTNHGDLTRGGLDRRGVNLAGTDSSHIDVHEGFPSPSGVHVMSSRLVRDGQDVARVWGDAQAVDPSSQFQRWRGTAQQWHGPGEGQSRGPVSWPSTRMEVALEWDGSGLSPWSDLTSPAPLDAGAGDHTGPVNEDEQTMLTDMLMTERFVSNAYDAAVFDSANPQVRRVLQQIQKDEQRHGERLSDQLAGRR